MIQEDIGNVVEMCNELLDTMGANEPVRALVRIELILGALRPYTEIAVASKITNVLVGIIGVVNGME